MKKRICIFIGSIAIAVSAGAQGPGSSGSYYQDADGKTGAELKTALCAIIYNRTERTYGDLWTDFCTTDVRDDGKVWDMYSGISNFTFGTDQDPGSGNKEGQYYNREHSWPNSWFGGKVQPMYTDLHHIYSTDNATNQKRSAWPYAEVTGSTEWSNELGTKLGYNYGYSCTVFEPADDYKGDVARIYFYMVTCYKDKKFSQGGKGYLMFTWDGTECGFTDKAIKCLLKWHRNDPVSQKEIDRNNKVAQKQGNRNPFVDDPELAEYIWGEKKNEAYACPANGIEDVVVPTSTVAVKVISDGHLYILREGEIYTITGERVK